MGIRSRNSFSCAARRLAGGRSPSFVGAQRRHPAEPASRRTPDVRRTFTDTLERNDRRLRRFGRTFTRKTLDRVARTFLSAAVAFALTTKQLDWLYLPPDARIQRSAPPFLRWRQFAHPVAPGRVYASLPSKST